MKEIIRFLSAIDPTDLENELLNSSHITESQSPVKGLKNQSSTSSITSVTSPLDESQSSARKLSKTRSYSAHDYQVTIQTIHTTVHDHAYFLLTNYRMKQLFGMFANLSGFTLKKWLTDFQNAKLVNSYVLGLSSLHFDFNWPYPILINQFKKSKLFSSISMKD